MRTRLDAGSLRAQYNTDSAPRQPE
jgi:hypothetical protein